MMVVRENYQISAMLPQVSKHQLIFIIFKAAEWVQINVRVSKNNGLIS